jgi:nicotinamide-nucleotide amidase
MGRPGPKETRPGLRAEVITVGTELTQGLIVDTNSAWISSRLAAIGIPTDFHTSVADDERRLQSVLTQAASRSDVVFVAGGLGPTADDLTRQAVAKVARKELVLHQPSLEVLKELFARWGREMSENNRLQAYLPEGAEVIPNGRGTACGFVVKIGRALVLVFPGVPHELYAMVDDVAIPYLRRLQAAPAVLRMRRLRTFGLGESQVDDKIRHLMAPERNPNVGLLVDNFVVTVKITAQAASEADADSLIAETEREVRELLGETIFGVDDETLAAAAAGELLTRGLTLALAESCTGGLVASWLTDISGISKSFLAGVVSYSDAAKRDILSVPEGLLKEHGAVSEPVARAMAEGVLRRTGADVALAVTGIAGPTGGTPEKPVGLVYIVRADRRSSEARECGFHGGRDRIRVHSALTALDMLRRWAMSLPLKACTKNS